MQHEDIHAPLRMCITRSSRHAYSETFIRDQITTLHKMAEVHTVHSGRFPERREDGTLLSPLPFWMAHKLVKGITGRRNTFFGHLGFKKFLSDRRIEVVLGNYGISAAHLVEPCRQLGVPLLAIFHGHDASNRRLLAAYRRRYLALFDYAYAVIAVSKDMQKGLIAMGANPDKVVLIPYGVDVEKFKPVPSRKEKMFLAVGRFVEKKGPEYTIRAFSEVLRKHPDARLVMVGKHDERYMECARLVTALDVGHAVSFPGVLSPDQVASLMARALAFVQHSVTAANGDMEGTPLSILEASASGLPIISTRHAGIKEAVVHGRTGFLVDEKDTAGMAEFMTKLLDDEALVPVLGGAGREHILKHHNQVTQIAKIHELAMKASGRLVTQERVLHRPTV